MTDYEKLKSIIEEIDNLIYHHVRSSAPAFEAWHTKSERFLIKKYGKDSLEHKKFCDTHFAPLIWCGQDEEEDIRISIKCCAEGLRSCKAVFETYLEDIVEENKATPQVVSNTLPSNMDRIFIVHGHDGELKQSVARIIEKQGIEAIILSEQANKGRTIIEKFEDYSDVGGAICLFTADDYGRAKKDEADNTRARQNVVLETGYFMGKLGRDHVVLLADKGIEMPSDLSGVVYTDTGSWQFALLQELNAMGYKVDLNKLL
jgi:predicted nucleotide-binding protein